MEEDSRGREEREGGKGGKGEEKGRGNCFVMAVKGMDAPDHKYNKAEKEHTTIVIIHFIRPELTWQLPQQNMILKYHVPAFLFHFYDLFCGRLFQLSWQHRFPEGFAI